MKVFTTITFIILVSTSLLAEIKKPSPDIKPEDVIKIQLSSLMKNNEPYLNAGIEQTWEFAHPSIEHSLDPFKDLQDDVCPILCCYAGSF